MEFHRLSEISGDTPHFSDGGRPKDVIFGHFAIASASTAIKASLRDRSLRRVHSRSSQSTALLGTLAMKGKVSPAGVETTSGARFGAGADTVPLAAGAFRRGAASITWRAAVWLSLKRGGGMQA